MTLLQQDISTSVSNAELKDKGFLNNLQSVINDKTTDPGFGVPQLAGYMHLSRTQLNRKLHYQIGYSPGKLILYYRLQRAKQLLSENQLSIKEIVWKCGFNSLSNFCRKFRRETGCSPTHYREKLISVEESVTLDWKMPINDLLMKHLVKQAAITPWLLDLLLFVLNNLENENLSSDVLAEKLLLSPSALNRKMNRLFKISPLKFVRDIRLHYACELIEAGNNSITDIAYKAGFFDTAHLCHCFKQAFNCSPGAYKAPAIKTLPLVTLKKYLMNQIDY
jgi:AraC-like DNA-binding protein